jgi:hypothetical protein
MSDPILLLAGRNRYEKQRVAKSPVPDTACQSTHRRQVRLVIRVDEGLGGWLTLSWRPRPDSCRLLSGGVLLKHELPHVLTECLLLLDGDIRRLSGIVSIKPQLSTIERASCWIPKDEQIDCFAELAPRK